MACAPGGSGYVQDCRACDDPALRKEWGCDAPTKEPYAWISPCPHCEGKGECVECDNAGMLPLHRCPNKIAGPREMDYVSMASLVEQGVLPDEGGWQDQPATFARAFPAIMREIQEWRAKAVKQAQEQARREAKQNGQRGRGR